MIRLTNEEIKAIEPPHCTNAETEYYHFNDGVDLGAKAQLKKVADTIDIEFIISILNQNKGYMWQKRGRDTCSKQITKLQELLKEIE